MRKFQVSIGQVMVLVVFVAVAAAELKKLTGWGPNATYTLMVGVVLSSLAGVALSRGTQQVCWIAFATFVSGYFIHALKYGTLRPPYLILANAFGYVPPSYVQTAEKVVFGHPSAVTTPPILHLIRLFANTLMAVLVTAFSSILARHFATRARDSGPSPNP